MKRQLITTHLIASLGGFNSFINRDVVKSDILKLKNTHLMIFFSYICNILQICAE